MLIVIDRFIRPSYGFRKRGRVEVGNGWTIGKARQFPVVQLQRVRIRVGNVCGKPQGSVDVKPYKKSREGELEWYL